MRLLRDGCDSAVDLMVSADATGWQKQTPCEDWEVRDLAGHFLDVAFSYLGYFTLADKEWTAPGPKGMRVYGEELSVAALAYRNLSQHELIARLVALTDELFSILDDLDEDQWAGHLIPHKYAGPLPAFMMATFVLMDLTVHTWDFQKALGLTPQLDTEASDVLVPYMFALHGVCFDTDQAGGVDLSVQINIGDAEQWAVSIKDESFMYAPGAAAAPQASFTFPDPAEFALDAYQRFEGGTAAGDPNAIRTFREIFFTV